MVSVFSALTRATGGRSLPQPAGTRWRPKSLSTLTLVHPMGPLTSTSKTWNLRIPCLQRLLTSLQVLWILIKGKTGWTGSQEGVNKQPLGQRDSPACQRQPAILAPTRTSGPVTLWRRPLGITASQRPPALQEPVQACPKPQSPPPLLSSPRGHSLGQAGLDRATRHVWLHMYVSLPESHQATWSLLGCFGLGRGRIGLFTPPVLCDTCDM